MFLSKPGITGLAQVCGYDMSDPEKLSEIDNLYIKNCNLLLNIKILMATLTPSLGKTLRDLLLKIFNV